MRGFISSLLSEKLITAGRQSKTVLGPFTVISKILHIKLTIHPASEEKRYLLKSMVEEARFYRVEERERVFPSCRGSLEL
jgi:hypothetical protein